MPDAPPRRPLGRAGRQDGCCRSRATTIWTCRHHPGGEGRRPRGDRAYGVGAGASRLVTGDHPLYAELELRLARLKGTEAACVFGSGYLANAGIIPTFAGRGDLILIDELSHACIWAGAQLSGAESLAFRHNDAAHVAAAARRAPRPRIATPWSPPTASSRWTATSRRWTSSPRWRSEFDAWLMADDAHGLGFGSGRAAPACRCGSARCRRRSAATAAMSAPRSR